MELLKLCGSLKSPALNKPIQRRKTNVYKQKGKRTRRWVPKISQSHQKYLNLGSWNVRSLLLQKSNVVCLQDKRPIVAQEAARLNLDILCLSETHLLNLDNIQIEGYTLIWSGNSKIRQNGVAIMVKDKLIFKNVKVIQNNISDRIMLIEVIINGNYVSVLSIYAPTEVAEKRERKDFYTLLQSTVTAISPTNTVIIVGDFNARMGHNEDIDNGSNIFGKYANAFTNKNRQLLVDFFRSQKFAVVNSFSKEVLLGLGKIREQRNGTKSITYSIGDSNEVQFNFVALTLLLIFGLITGY